MTGNADMLDPVPALQHNYRTARATYQQCEEKRAGLLRQLHAAAYERDVWVETARRYAEAIRKLGAEPDDGST